MAKTAAQRYIGKVGKLAKKIREDAGYTLKEIKIKVYRLTPQEAVKKAAKQLKYEDGDRHRSVAVDGIAGTKPKRKSSGKTTSKRPSSKGKKPAKK